MFFSIFIQSTHANNNNIDAPPPTNEYFEALKNLGTGTYAQDSVYLDIIAKFPYQESIDALSKRFREALYTMITPGFPFASSQRICLEILEVLKIVGTQNNIQNFSDLLKIATTDPKIANNNLVNEIKISFHSAAEIMFGRKTKLASAKLDIKNTLRKNPKNLEPDKQQLLHTGPKPNQTQDETDTLALGLKNIQRIGDYLNAHVKGQPEVIESILQLEEQKLYFDQDKPALRIFMGLPGNGKDSTVIAYVNAINNDSEAYTKHLFRVPVLKKEADLWKILGSSTGYVGSEDIPEFIKFLVNHSGGRYLIKTEESAPGKKGREYIIENETWIRNGKKPLPGYDQAEKAVVYFDEFQDWSKSMKSAFKKVLEMGLIQINSEKGGLSSFISPTNFFIATNEGINLLAPREANGQRYGEPLPYTKVLENWENTHKNILLLRNALLASNGGVNNPGDRENAPGIAEEVLARLPNEAFLLFRPLSPQHLQEIVEYKLNELKVKIKKAENKLGPIELKWSPDILSVIQNYKYVAEENARPMEDRVKSLVETTLLRAFSEKKITRTANGQTLEISIQFLPDQTAELVVLSDNPQSQNKELHLPITTTENDRIKPVISDLKIDEILTHTNQMNEKVFGVSHIVNELTIDTLLSEEFRNINKSDTPARTYMFLGMSSTGKTETAKQLAGVRYGSTSTLKILDFSQVQSIPDLKEKILGKRDYNNNPISSDFMKEYDSKNGKLIIVLDEIANTPLEVLKALYDIFREPTVTTFSDSKPRVMSGVTLILTGNALDLSNQVPMDIPELQQLAALEEIYKELQNDRQARRSMLVKSFSPALLSRIGEPNIYIFGPMGFGPIRNLTQFRLGSALNSLKPQNGVRGWDIGFVNESHYINLVEGIENAGFVLREQGASINRFVNESFTRNLHALLLKNKIPTNSKVVLEVIKKGDLKEASKNITKNGMISRDLEIKVYTENQTEPLVLKIKGKEDPVELKDNKIDKILTAYHEAGHEIVRKSYFHDKTSSSRISIIPGVTTIGDRLVYYAGVASHQQTERTVKTRQSIIRYIAVNAAGYIAQKLVSMGNRHDAGKANDMERATELAMDAILRYGLSERFGTLTAPAGMSNEVFLSTLSPERVTIFHQEVALLLNQGIALAEHALLANYKNVLIPLGKELAIKGEMDSNDLARFYKNHKVLNDSDPQFRIQFDKATITGVNVKASTAKSLRKKSFNSLSNSALALQALEVNRDAQLLPHIPVPETIAEINELIGAKKDAAVATVPLPKNIPVYEFPFNAAKASKPAASIKTQVTTSSAKVLQCKILLKKMNTK